MEINNFSISAYYSDKITFEIHFMHDRTTHPKEKRNSRSNSYRCHKLLVKTAFAAITRIAMRPLLNTMPDVCAGCAGDQIQSKSSTDEKMRNCLLCNPNLYKPTEILRYGNFHIVTDYYPLGAPHFLISHIDHYGAVGELSVDDANELKAIQELLLSIVADYAGAAESYEHGQAGSCNPSHVGESTPSQHCHHMHLHVLSGHYCLESEIDDFLDPVTITSFAEILDIYGRFGPYIYYRNSQNQSFVYPKLNREVPPHLMRTIIARKQGLEFTAEWGTSHEIFDHRKAISISILEELKQRLIVYNTNKK